MQDNVKSKNQIDSIYPLSPMQEGMVFHTLYAPHSGVYVQQFVLTLSGNLNVSAFERAWRRVVELHPVLRTLFVWKNRQNPLQVVCKSVNLPWRTYDWRSLSSGDREQRLSDFLQTQREEGFELDKAPLMCCTLIQTGDRTYQFVWSHHHLLMDGWCLPIILKDVWAFYEAFNRGEDLYLEAPPPYRNYIAWLRQQDLSAAQKFWRSTLAGFTTPTPLVVDKLGVNFPNKKDLYHERDIQLSTQLTDTLKSLARQHHLTLNTLVQAAWALLLASYSRETDVVFGSTVSGRPPALPQVEAMVGLFINTLPVRVQITPETPLLSWLKQLQAQQVEREQYSYTPLVEIQGMSDVPRNLPLFESIVVFENYPLDYSLLEGKESVKISNVVALERTNYPLTIRVVPGGEFSIQISYDTNRFDEETIARLLGHVQTLLENIAANPHSRISDVQWVSEAERQQLFVEWNDTLKDYSQNQCLHQWFEEQVKRTPDSIAVVFEDRQLTYQQLNRRANQLARYLQTLGVRSEVLVGICLERSIEMVVGLLGILKAGGAYVPLDPSYPPERLEFMLLDSQVPILLTTEPLLSELPANQAQVLCLDRESEAIDRQAEENPVSRIEPENLAYTIYTSGSTGQPKGAMNTHQGICNRLLWMQDAYQLTASDRVLQKTPFSFDVSVWEFFWPLVTGAQLILAKPEGHKDSAYLVKLIAESQITTVHFVPSMLVAFLEERNLETCNNLRQVFCSGEALSKELADRFLARLGAKLHNLYGPTEAAVDVTFWECDRTNSLSIVPIGRPIANTEIYILNPHLQPVAIGVPGELYIGGVQLARGYHNRPDLSADRFIPSPFSDKPGARLYKTGDLARYQSDGNIEFIGRIDNQVKIRGFRIELGEIEAVLSQHPKVQAAVVMVREDIPGDKRLVAYTVSTTMPDRLPYQQECRVDYDGNILQLQAEYLSTNGIALIGVPSTWQPERSVRLCLQLPGVSESQWLSGRVTGCRGGKARIHLELNDPESQRLVTEGFHILWERTFSGKLRRFVAEKLPEYMVPSSFVSIDRLPLTPNGKVDRKALPVPDTRRSAVEGDVAAPSTPVEKAIAQIWAEVLNLDWVGRDENFLELGGHSLFATQIISRMRQTFEVEVPLRAIFDTPTVGQLAQQLETLRQEELSWQQEAIVPVSRDRNLPLSFSQQQLWFLYQREPELAVYNVFGTLELPGTLDVVALERSLNEIVRRHEILRTTFQEVDGQPVQAIHPELKLSLPVVDLQGFPESEREAEALRLANAEAQLPFDLTTGPLLRATLIQFGAQDYRLFLALHHIIIDVGSLYEVLTAELAILYQAFSSGQASPLPEPTLQYADFTVWQRRSLEGEVLDKQFDYWKQQLADLPVLQLPTDRPHPPRQTFTGANQSMMLSERLSKAIETIGVSTGVTLFTVLLAAFTTLLYRYSEQDDIAIGTVTSSRSRSEIEKMMGYFLNTLVLRTDLSDNPTFRELLDRVEEVCLEAYAHQEVPFAYLVEKLQPQRPLDRNPLFQVMFVLVPPMPDNELGWTNGEVEVDTGTAKFDLTLLVEQRGSKLLAHWEYNTDLFEDTTIARMMGHFLTLLEAIVATPDWRIAELPLMSDRERQQLLGGDRTDTDYPSDQCIHQLFERQVERTPDAVAVVFAEESVTYRELNRRANQLAHYLQNMGVKPEVLVGICVERSIEMVVGLLGILKAGGAYVPLDPAYPEERLSFMLEHSQASVLLTQKRFLEIVPQHQESVVCLDRDWEAIAQCSDRNLASDVTPENLAYIIYTSGSTGLPKGVAIEHQGATNTLLDINDRFEIGSCDRVLAVSSLCFDLSVYDIFGLLAAGGTVVIPNPSATPDPLHWSALMVQQQVTVWNSAPALMQMLIDVTTGKPQPLPNSLRLVLLSGDWIPLSLPARIQALVSGVRIISLGGATEASIWSILYPIETLDPTWTSIPYGRGMRNQRFYVLDRNFELCPVGIPGQLYIAGVGLARCYWRDEEKTRSRFITHPKTGERLYCTGDLGSYRSDGNIEFIGRIDNQVKIRGFRIELGEIEAVLSQHPDVRQAAVIDREDAAGNKYLVAYAVSTTMPDRLPYQQDCRVEYQGTTLELQAEDLSVGGMALVGVPSTWQPRQPVRLYLQLPGVSESQWLSGRVAWCRGGKAGIQFELSESQSQLVDNSVKYLLETEGFYALWQRTFSGNLRRFSAEKLPEYMVPSSFVLLDSLPLTPNGKVDRKALPAPDTQRAVVDREWAAPSTHIEKAIAQIWAEVLNVERVGVDENFLELGGHSLLATQIISRMREAFQVEVPLRSMFDRPTVGQLAKQLETLRQEELGWQQEAIVPVSRDRHLPVSFPQQQLWFLERWEPDLAVYNEVKGLYLQGKINAVALERSLNEIVRRHEILRTTFQEVDGQPVQVIHPEMKLSLSVVDLQGLPESEREAEALRLANAQWLLPFDLSAGPLLRVTLMQLGEEDYWLFSILHHIITDGVSLHLLLPSELAILYQAFSSGQASPLPEPTLQYADFAVWQQRSLQGEVLERQLGYWKQQLADLPVLQLPTDRPHPPRQTFAGAKQSMMLSESLAEAIQNVGQKEGVTLFTVLLAVFTTLLYRYSGQDDIAIGTVTSGRSRGEIEKMMGYFLNTLVLRTDLSENPTFRELVHRVEEVCIGAYAHQDVPFTYLVEKLQPQRQLDRNPLFQVMFLMEPPIPDNELGWTSVQLPEAYKSTAKFDLTLVFVETSQTLFGYWEYNTDLFDDETIARMRGHFQTLLEAIVANPEQRICALPLITQQERQQLLLWNQTHTDYPRSQCIHELFEEQVERTPDAVAVVFEDKQLTYQQLNQRANQLARYLQSLGVGPEVLVGICLERSIEMVVGLLGILKAGGAYVPLDPEYPQERLTYMIEDTRVPVLLTQKRLLRHLVRHQARAICLDTDWEEIAKHSVENPVSWVRSDNLAYVIYTSGSTGKPKGVSIIHQGIVRLVKENNYANLGPKEVFLQLAPVSFDASTFEIWGCLLNGGRLAILPPEKPSLEELGQAIVRYQVTTVWLTAGLFHLMVDRHLEVLKSVRQLLAGGDILAVSHVQKFIKQVNRCQLINGYGPTENTTFTCCYTIKELSGHLISIPIGKPIANTQVYILDDRLQQVPIGVPGELYIGGDGLGRGYLNRPDITADRFLPNPFSDKPGARLYKTGDLARYLPDGNIEFIGRIDHQVKIRGFRIELGEIETALTQHPDVQAAVVMVREDIPDDKRLVAYIVSLSSADRIPYKSECEAEFEGDRSLTLRTKNISSGGIGVLGVPADCQPGQRVRIRLGAPDRGATRWISGHVAWCSNQEAGIDFDLLPTEQELLNDLLAQIQDKQSLSKVMERTLSGNLRRYLQEKLPHYMVPSSFVFLNALPLTPNGKVNRKALPQPELDRLELQDSFVAPQNDLEQAIASIWQEVLHLEKVGVHDNFFDLGGHSLSMARVHTQLRSVLQANVSMVELFKYPTIATLAQCLLSQQKTVDAPAKVSPESDSLQHSRNRAQKQKEALNRQKQLRQQRRTTDD